MTHKTKNAGFILSLELLLILTVLGIGLVVGVVAVRDAIFKYMNSQQNNEVFVSDSNDTNMGVAVGFDEHEAPLLIFTDSSGDTPYRALIGIRDDRFTSREPVYYTLPNCQGDPCVKSPSDENADSAGTGLLPGTGSVSYFNALQAGPTYAVGAGPDGERIKGSLYRETPQACEYNALEAAQGSRWMSQKVVSGEPCEPHVLPLPVELPGYFCPGISAAGFNICSPECSFDGGSTGNGNGFGRGNNRNNSCSCPAGYEANSLDGGATYCCPEGASFEGGVFNPQCTEAGLMQAISVPTLDDVTINALSTYLPPFSVNAATNTQQQTYTQIAPDTEDGSELP